MKNIFCMILFMILSFSVSFGYTDLDNNHWAYNSIYKLSNNGCFSGYPDGSFKPDKNMTRAEFLSVLINSIMPNIDVSSNTDYWADKIILIAAENNILDLSNYDKEDFDKEITRLEIFNMLFSCLEAPNDMVFENGEYFSDISRYNQKEYYITAVLRELNIIKGYPDGSSGIDKLSTRAEVACMIFNFLKNKDKLEELTEIVAYKDDVAVISLDKLPYNLKKWKDSKCEVLATTKIKDISIFEFKEDVPKKYKKTFDLLYNSDSRYCEYRVKFGENNYVLAIDFETTNNTEESILYGGHEFLRVSFSGEDLRIVDSFDIAEIKRQLARNASVGEIIMPSETLDTSAFYVLDKKTFEEIRLDRDDTTLYDIENECIKPANSFTSLIIRLEGDK